MCGICGFTGGAGPEAVQAMADSLVHRGPDACGFFHDPEAGVRLGHRRLFVLDISGGAQPMENHAGDVVVVYNGEIYNHAELRAELVARGSRFSSSHSDTEVIVHGYEQWGMELPSRLNGMWAFAVYDKKRRGLFLSRDRFGEKPLFYAASRGAFVFASELSALRKHPAVSAEISQKGLAKYLAYGYVPAPASLCEGVSKLCPGENLWVDLDGPKISRRTFYRYSIRPDRSLPPRPSPETAEELCALLSDAVRIRLEADVPLGVLLSGGVDSGAVAAMAARHAGANRVRTFSMGFREKTFDESGKARSLARSLATDHREFLLSMDGARDLCPEIVARLDEPLADSSLIPTYVLCREVRREVTVALSGDGGDELFAGYDPFKALALADLYDRAVPRPVHRAVSLLASRLPVSHRNISLDFALKRTLRGLSHHRKLWNAVWMGPLGPEELCALFPFSVEEIYEDAIACWDSCPSPDLTDRTQEFFTHLYLGNDILVKADRASMMHSLELRAPFLDVRLADFASRLPAGYKFARGRGKRILKQALSRVLPRSVLDAPKKGFGAPVGPWFAQGFLPLAENGLLDRGFVSRMLSEHRKHKADHRLFLWAAYVLFAHAENR
ncbi:MAG: asparagine synthase (glutamine-hydrolyzing) [Thermodesulfobacteriota bacterium]